MSRVKALAGSALFLLLAPGVVAGLAPWAIRRAAVEALGPGLLQAAGVALALPGLLALLASFLRFAWEGRGTPAPIAPTRTLVITGLYRHVRNPMYVAVLALILGQALAYASLPTLAYGLVIWTAFHSFVLAYEEPSLRRRFADQYSDYVRAVPRWIPRLKPWSPS